jgi:type II restriction enzyme
MDKDIEEKWIAFVKKYGTGAYAKVDEFLTDLEKTYKAKKIAEFQGNGVDHPAAINKARQSWVAYVGAQLEGIVRSIVEPIAEQHGAKIVSDKEIGTGNLDPVLDSVRRNLIVHFDNYSYLPDADLIVYKYDKGTKKADVLAVLSVKNSFRERYTETPYWKLKLGQSSITKGIHVFMVTTDRDDEISFTKRPSKARVILEYELDGVYITKNEGEFDPSAKIQNISGLLTDLASILKKH